MKSDDVFFNPTSPREVKRILKQMCLHPQKKWGQNFLIDQNIARKIITEIKLTEDDYVVEIGPGLGALTVSLSAVCRQLLAIEIDPGLSGFLQGCFCSRKNVLIITGDVRKANLGDFCRQAWATHGDFSPVKIAANLPYYITSPFIFDLIRDRNFWACAVLMVQKEVAERIVALPGTANYGALSVICQFFTRARTAFTVSSKVFYPQPQVDSAVVFLEPLDLPKEAKEKDCYIKLVTGLFQHRRKTLLNTLSYFLGSKDDAAAVLLQAGLNSTLRPESLQPAEFAKISGLIYN